VFNYYLIEAIKGKAADTNGIIEFGNVAAYIQNKMEAWSKRHPGMAQHPIYELKGAVHLVIGKIKEEIIEPMHLVFEKVKGSLSVNYIPD
jgi:hypothetical protein